MAAPCKEVMHTIFMVIRAVESVYRNLPVPVAAYNLKSNVFCRKAFTEMNHI
jgi:hypothetical protein